MRSVLKDEMDLILHLYDKKMESTSFNTMTRCNVETLKRLFTLEYKNLFRMVRQNGIGQRLGQEKISYSILKLRRLIALWESEGIISVPGGVHYSAGDKGKQFPLFAGQNFSVVPTTRTIKTLQAKSIKQFIDDYNAAIESKGLDSSYSINNLKDLRNALMKRINMPQDTANYIVKLYGEIASKDEIPTYTKTI